jgi:diaminohydroxyphosphoribosylaminopyrimidine deaminase / 5-amino-6-(5-phosphoribosylamino)uracil reductase
MFDADDRRYMRKALSLAEKGIGRSSPNPSVGCVVVRNGEIVGRGWHEYALLDHAEIAALRDAGPLARRATVYVTLEPCSHYGRTPPCADRLIEAGVRRVVVARVDPNPRVSGRGIDRLRSAGIRVDVGLMREGAGKLIEPFACHVTTGFPLVVSKVGMSLDGKIGTGRSRNRWITSVEGREFGQRLRLVADAVLVGVETILSDDPELTYRGTAPKVRPLTRVVLDSTLRTPAAARLFQSSPRAPVLIFCRKNAAQKRSKALTKAGAEIITVPHKGNLLDLKAVLRELGKRGVLCMLVEGGSRVHWAFLSDKLVDSFYFIIAPLVLGGDSAIPSVGGEGYRSAEDSPKFRIRSCFSAGPDMVVEAYPSYSRSIISPWLPRENVPFREPGRRTALKRI